ncbi:MAG: L,D-transpeptidase [Myxococcales bacterium]|nr:L,D-transpeptidase [Myxococcales bacterium]
MARAVPFLFVLALAAHALADVPSAEQASAKPEARIWSRGQTTWIYAEPKRTKNALGYVRLGQSVAKRADEPVKGPGCAGVYQPVEPYGWVCMDRTASDSGSSRWLRAMAAAAPRTTLMPFEFALSNGAPMYRRLPTAKEVEKERPAFGEAGKFKPQAWGNRGHEKLAEVRTVADTGPVPWFLGDGGSAGEAHPLEVMRRQIPHGSMLAYSAAFTHEGRSYLLSSDGTVVPADRVRPFRVSEFRGVALGKDNRLPLAFFRARPRPKLRRVETGFEPTGASFAARSHVELDPGVDAAEANGKRFLATRERVGQQIVWVAEDDATVIREREQLPIGVAAGSKWILHSITQGTLIAFEDKRAVYATLASPGAGGVPIKGKDPVKMSTTPLGVYRITFKHRATTMSPEYGENRKFWIADVPYTQYFNAPFALHTAYWHEDFGEPMSAGCVNVSPRDGKWLFDWTSPTVPTGWGGAGPGGRHGAGTYVVIAR